MSQLFNPTQATTFMQFLNFVYGFPMTYGMCALEMGIN